MELSFGEYRLEEPKYSERGCRLRDYTSSKRRPTPPAKGSMSGT